MQEPWEYNVSWDEDLSIDLPDKGDDLQSATIHVNEIKFP